MRRMAYAATVSVAALMLACSGGGTDDDGNSGFGGPAPAETTTAAKGAPGPRVWGEGTYRVGKDITAGEYVTTADEGSFGCYWERSRNLDGELTSIIANGNLSAGAKGRIVVKATDKGVRLSGDCKWTREAQ